VRDRRVYVQIAYRLCADIIITHVRTWENILSPRLSHPKNRRARTRYYYISECVCTLRAISNKIPSDSRWWRGRGIWAFA